MSGEGVVLGEAMEAAVVPSEPKEADSVPSADQLEMETSLLVQHIAMKDNERRKERLCELFSESLKLPEDQKRCFCEQLKKHHLAFSVEEYERGQTDLVQLVIDPGEAQQRPRRIPFAVKEEVSRQLQKMQDARVIQASNSPRASPVVLERKKDGTSLLC